MWDEGKGGVKALVFDVFGTVVDWRGSIIRELETLGRQKGLSADWARFADDWRGGYQPAMQRVRTGTLPWTRIDDLHRMILAELLAKYAITGLSEAEKAHLNRAWHRLDPWPDAVEGLARLKRRFIIARSPTATRPSSSTWQSARACHGMSSYRRSWRGITSPIPKPTTCHRTYWAWRGTK